MPGERGASSNGCRSRGVLGMVLRLLENLLLVRVGTTHILNSCMSCTGYSFSMGASMLTTNSATVAVAKTFNLHPLGA